MRRNEYSAAKRLIKRNAEFLKRTASLKHLMKRRKRTSSGRDLVVYCEDNGFIWHPGTKGFGGSEEAVINLTRELTKLGWQTTVYNNCGHKPVSDAGVTYRPWRDFDPRDKQDIVIVWRWMRALDWSINAERIFIDAHDIMDDRILINQSRIKKITRIIFKSQFHRSLCPNLPDQKTAIIPNGLDFALLDGDGPKDSYLLINTSSADRSMSVLPKLFLEVKRHVPQARLQWAYGWELFKLYNAHDRAKLEWMYQIQEEMYDAGIETLGHLTQAAVAKLYRRAAILAYPTDFPEIDCISARKAQACGCVPVTSDFGALAETVQFGVKVPIAKENIWEQGRFHFGIGDIASQRLWIDATVHLLSSPTDRSELAVKGATWARQFSWPQIAARWDKILRE
jgi:glycosyltransferase involved in cell wall biosynthesis